MSALLAAHPRRNEGDEVGIDWTARFQYGPAFTGLVAAYIGEGATATVLAEVALPRPNPLAARCLRRAPGAAGCLFSVR